MESLFTTDGKFPGEQQQRNPNAAAAGFYFLVANSSAIHYHNLLEDYVMKHDANGTIIWKEWGEGLDHPLSRWEKIRKEDVDDLSVVAIIPFRSWTTYFMMNLSRVDM